MTAKNNIVDHKMTIFFDRPELQKEDWCEMFSLKERSFYNYKTKAEYATIIVTFVCELLGLQKPQVGNLSRPLKRSAKPKRKVAKEQPNQSITDDLSSIPAAETEILPKVKKVKRLSKKINLERFVEWIFVSNKSTFYLIKIPVLAIESYAHGILIHKCFYDTPLLYAHSIAAFISIMFFVTSLNIDVMYDKYDSDYRTSTNILLVAYHVVMFYCMVYFKTYTLFISQTINILIPILFGIALLFLTILAKSKKNKSNIPFKTE